MEVAADIDWKKLAKLTDGYSGDDITNVCRDASMNGMRRKIMGKTPEEIKAMTKSQVAEPVSQQDMLESIKRISSSVAKARFQTPFNFLHTKIRRLRCRRCYQDFLYHAQLLAPI